MNTEQSDFFYTDTNRVITAYVDGQLQVVVAHVLDLCQRKAFERGITRIPGIRSCALDSFAPFSEDNTAFIVAFTAKGLPRCEAIRLLARDFALGFVDDLQPIPIQSSLF